jgi:hypothetical protein
VWISECINKSLSNFIMAFFHRRTPAVDLFFS